jgi:hypothetical protein
MAQQATERPRAGRSRFGEKGSARACPVMPAVVATRATTIFSFVPGRAAGAASGKRVRRVQHDTVNLAQLGRRPLLTAQQIGHT